MNNIFHNYRATFQFFFFINYESTDRRNDVMLFSFSPACHCPRNFTESWMSRAVIVIVKNKSTAIFLGLYTLINHGSDVKMFKTWVEPRATLLLWSIRVWTMASCCCWFVRFGNDCQGSCRINYACACNPFLYLLAFSQ